MRSPPDALAAPDIEDVRYALLVVAAVGATRLDEAMPLTEPLRSRVRRERSELQTFWVFTLRDLHKSSADAASGDRRLYVELIEPSPI